MGEHLTKTPLCASALVCSETHLAVADHFRICIGSWLPSSVREGQKTAIGGHHKFLFTVKKRDYTLLASKPEANIEYIMGKGYIT